MSALASTATLPRLSGLARTKMQSVFGRGSREDSTGLHRWVLLKNSIVLSTPELAVPSVTVASAEEAAEAYEQDVFTFPLLDNDDVPPGGTSESEWLDSLLETLDDNEDEDDNAGLDASALEEEAVFTPYSSPTSSAENLVEASLFCAPPPAAVAATAVSYPIPYPPLGNAPGLYADELDDLPVPDAIEDTSDDESDAPATPSSTASSLLSLMEHHHHHHHRQTQGPRIVLDGSNPFDPLPFAEEPHNPPDLFAAYEYQQC
jgi:hypothetical protein